MVIGFQKGQILCRYDTVNPFKGSLANCEDEDEIRGWSRISEKGVHMYKGVGVPFADFLLIVLKTYENEIIWSHWDQIITFS